ncbi:MAG TPA: hypothetical protein VK629_04560 [Steroidobacteraceae bacterium]|nr:hypothetical protein [Steroidobacteraceae bacterium]
MKLNAHDLEAVAGLTLQHYDERAENFPEGTLRHDVSQNIAALPQLHRVGTALGDPRLWLRAWARSQGICRASSKTSCALTVASFRLPARARHGV